MSIVAAAGAVICSAAASAGGGFVSLCEANQVYDTGKSTGEADRQICRCIAGKLDSQREDVAIRVFRKVLAARRDGLGLHPSQVDLDELVALMSFSDDLSACGANYKATHAGY